MGQIHGIAAIGHQLEGNVGIEAADHQHNDKKDGRWSKQRPGNVAQLCPGTGAIHTGGLIEFSGDRLQPGEENDRRPADAFPDVEQDDRDQGQDRVGEPEYVFRNQMENILQK